MLFLRRKAGIALDSLDESIPNRPIPTESTTETMEGKEGRKWS